MLSDSGWNEIIIITNLNLCFVPFVEPQRLHFADMWSKWPMNLSAEVAQKHADVVWRPFRTSTAITQQTKDVKRLSINR